MLPGNPRIDRPAMRAALFAAVRDTPRDQIVTIAELTQQLPYSRVTIGREVKLLREANLWPWPQSDRKGPKPPGGKYGRNGITKAVVPVKAKRETQALISTGKAYTLLHGYKQAPRVDLAEVARRAEIRALAKINRTQRKAVAG